MRLTQELRSSIASACIKAQFSKREEKLAKEEHALGMKLYRECFDAKDRTAAARLPKKWLRQDSCLQFNCGGYFLTFRVSEAVPVPYSTSCARLGNITGPLSDEAKDFAQREQDFKAERTKAHNALLTMLSGITTMGALEKTWPEGNQFYARFMKAKEGASLPAVQVDEINSMLGLKAA